MLAALDSPLNRSFATEDGRILGVRATAVDSGGHFTNSVYQYCHRNFNRRIFAIKGVGGEGRALAGKPTRNNIVKCRVFPIGVDTIKDLVFARLRIEEPGAGYISFSDELNEEYFRQLTAEKIITKFVRGFKKRVFTKIRPRNEGLDCFVYSIAAYSIINVSVKTIADKIQAKLAETKTESVEEDVIKKRPFIQKANNGWLNAWR